MLCFNCVHYGMFRSSIFYLTFREDEDSEADDIKPPADVIKPEGRKLLGPTKSRRKREAKQKRRLARSEVMLRSLNPLSDVRACVRVHTSM